MDVDHSTSIIDYAKSLDCIHCGLCLESCPTYRLTGRESSSPRGRIHIMRAVAEGRLDADDDVREELGFCLLCRGCESVCPSGVQFGSMMETARDGLAHTGRLSLVERVARRIGFGLLARSARLRWAASFAGFAQRTGLLRLVAPLLGARGRALAEMPEFPRASERRPLPESSHATSTRRGAVCVLEGCLQRELFGEVNRATASVLNAAGLDVRAPRTAGCCGSLHAHNGELDAARELAKKLIVSFEGAADEALPIVVNSAGCSAHMKQYAELFSEEDSWHERAVAFAARVRDLSEQLARPEEKRALEAVLQSPSIPGPIAFDDPCHLCHGQGVRREPRELLDALPGLERVELENSELCCGSAGIYSLLRPADSMAVLEPKLEALRASGARTLVTANPGCQLQWSAGVQRAGLDVRVMHVAEVLASALPPSS